MGKIDRQVAAAHADHQRRREDWRKTRQEVEELARSKALAELHAKLPQLLSLLKQRAVNDATSIVVGSGLLGRPKHRAAWLLYEEDRTILLGEQDWWTERRTVGVHLLSDGRVHVGSFGELPCRIVSINDPHINHTKIVGGVRELMTRYGS